MIQEFSFSWNGRTWNGYFNAIANETLIAHFEDDSIRERIGQTVAYFKTDKGAVSCSANTTLEHLNTGIYDAILKGVEQQLGKSLTVYLN